MADGSTIMFQLYEVEIDWQGDVRTAEVVSTDGRSLIGMGLLQGSELRMMIEDAGVIEITPFDQL